MKTGKARHRLFAAAATAVLTLFAHGPAPADEALVAVAANFAEAAEALREDFEQNTGHRLLLTTGSTGKLYAQISRSAPFHALLSADEKTPALLESERKAVPGSRFTYAVGRLALWSADPGRIGADGRAALLAPSVRHIAIANPALAPYGAAAREALQALEIWEAVRARIVMGENVGQAHSFVATGAAELGFVAYSAVLSPRLREQGSHWEVPGDLYQPIRQDAVLLLPGQDRPVAAAFLEYLHSPAARQTIARYGYGTD